jgi:hypothetical protein
VDTAAMKASEESRASATAQAEVFAAQLGALAQSLDKAAQTNAKATVQSAKLAEKNVGAQTQALAQVVGKLDESLAALAQSQLNVNVTAPPPQGVSEAVLAQAKLVEGTLAPLLAALKDGIKIDGALAVPAPAAPATKKSSSKKKDAPAPVNVTADLGEVPGQVTEALELLRALKEMADSGELSANKSYKPWTRKAVGTSAKDGD